MQRIKDFFIEASLHGWAAPKDQQVEKTTILDLPGSEVYPFTSENPLYEGLLCKDVYFVNGQFSQGSIQIWENGDPVWYMSYGGFCADPRAIPVLKAALYSAYQDGKFYGGRGPAQFTQWGENTWLQYFNYLALHQDQGKSPKNKATAETEFKRFDGAEEVVEVFNLTSVLFQHRFSGGALIPDEE